MKAYIVTRHHLEDDYNTFGAAAFTTRDAAEKFMRDSFNAAVRSYKDDGHEFEDEDTDLVLGEDHAWITLSHNDRDDRQFHILEVEMDEEWFSDFASLD